MRGRRQGDIEMWNQLGEGQEMHGGRELDNIIRKPIIDPMPVRAYRAGASAGRYNWPGGEDVRPSVVCAITCPSEGTKSDLTTTQPASMGTCP